MFGGFLVLSGSPYPGNRLKFWYAFVWINAINLALTFALTFAIVAAAALAWKRYG